MAFWTRPSVRPGLSHQMFELWIPHKARRRNQDTICDVSCIDSFCWSSIDGLSSNTLDPIGSYYQITIVPCSILSLDFRCFKIVLDDFSTRLDGDPVLLFGSLEKKIEEISAMQEVVRRSVLFLDIPKWNIKQFSPIFPVEESVASGDFFLNSAEVDTPSQTEP